MLFHKVHNPTDLLAQDLTSDKSHSEAGKPAGRSPERMIRHINWCMCYPVRAARDCDALVAVDGCFTAVRQVAAVQSCFELFVG